MHLFLAFSCLNDYFHTDAIIYFLANRLVFQNMVTFKNFCTPQISTATVILLRLTEVLHLDNSQFLAKQLSRKNSLWINLLLGQKLDELIKQNDFMHLACEQFYQ